MQKIKVFSGSDFLQIERAVNDFIKDKKVIDIKLNSVFLPLEYKNNCISKSTVCDRVLIIYEEVE